MEKKVYKGFGKTPKEALVSLWELMQYTDDCCLRKENGGWRIRLNVIPPTDEERRQFELL